MISSLANREGLGGNSVRKLGMVMNADRILGALIWCVWNDQLPDDLLELIEISADDLPKFMAITQDDTKNLIAMAQGYVRTNNPSLRDQAIVAMKGELKQILEAKS